MTSAARTPGTTPLIAATFLMASASIAIFPLLPDLQAELGLSTGILGLVTAAGFLAAVVAQVAVAPLADRGHERSLLVAGLLTSAAALVAAAFAWDAASLVLARSLEGFAFGTFVPAARAITARRSPHGPAEALGRLSAAEFAGVALGPLAAALLASAFSTDVALLTFAVLSVVTVPVALRAADARVTLVTTAGHGAGEPRMGFDLLRRKPMQVALLLTIALIVPVGAYDTLWARYMVDNGATTLLVGASLTVFAIPYILFASRAGRLADRLGPVRGAVAGMLLTSAVIVAYGFLRNPWTITGVGMIESTGQALAGPAAQASVANAVPRDRVAAAQGLAGAVGTAAAGIVAALAAPIYGLGGQELLFSVTAALVLALLAAAVLRNRSSQETSTSDTSVGRSSAGQWPQPATTTLAVSTPSTAIGAAPAGVTSGSSAPVIDNHGTDSRPPVSAPPARPDGWRGTSSNGASAVDAAPIGASASR